MKNVKLGFQLAVGWYLGKVLIGLPAVTRDPYVQKQWARLKQAIMNTKSEDQTPEKESKAQPRKTSAFPQCKRDIGFGYHYDRE